MLTQQQPMGFYDMNNQQPNSDMNQMASMQDSMFPPFNMMNPYAMGFDPNMMMNPSMMMGFPQGAYDPNLMMNQINPNYTAGFNVPSGNFQNQGGNHSKNGTNL
jgi:hypothetical protein